MVKAAVRKVVALAFGLLNVHKYLITKHRIKTKDSEDKKIPTPKQKLPTNSMVSTIPVSDMKYKYVLFTTVGCQCGWYTICSTAL